MVMVGKWRYWSVGLCLVLGAASASADSLDAQRVRYQQIKQAWDNKQMDSVEQLMPTLRDYPLYPYLAYRALTQDLSQVSAQQIKLFLQQYPTLPPARSLPARYVNELARREDWISLLAFSPQPPKPVAARCNYYYAQYVTGHAAQAWQGAQTIWLSGQSLPASCDKLFEAWKGAGGQSTQAVLARLRLALEKGNQGLVQYLLQQLPSNDQTLSRSLTALQADPRRVALFAREVAPSDFSRDVVEVAFTSLARQDADAARDLLPTLVRLQHIPAPQRQRMEETIAWRLMGGDVSAADGRWRDAVIRRSHNSALLERRLRMALGTGDQAQVREWLGRLPASVRDKDEWRYWRALTLIEQGKRSEGEGILRALTRQRGFYPMVAAQRLGIPYPLQVARAQRPDAALAQEPAIARVRELMYWNMDNTARSEWNALVASKPRPQQEALARYALEQGWADLSVQATIVAKLWDHLQERFPLAWRQDFRMATEDKGITQSYAMAIARQESAWNPEARSSVGASGLMQLMPATAQHTAKMYNLGSYQNSSQLLDPKTNIDLGTRYLEYVFQSLGRNRILASAAYNAGPSRVNTWLANSAGRIDAVAFIESIPFSETRGYVKNVLAYDAYYRHFMHRPDSILTEGEWQRRY